MTGQRARQLLGAAGWVGGVAAAFGLALGVPVPKPVSAAAAKYTPPPTPKGPFTLTGAVSCQQCHSEKEPIDNQALLSAKSTDFVRMTENRIWGTHDLHVKAYQNLTGPLGKQMETILATARGDAGYKVTADVACLSCHASDKDGAVPWAKKTADSFSTVNGVGCEMCHGHASAWRGVHGEIVEENNRTIVPWREWPHAEKSKWGLTDLRDPVVKADTCSSCHVGDVEKNRFVTHEMYAAGHPPLPPLDVTAYTRDQPRHWGLPAEMPYLTGMAKADPEKAWQLFHYRDEATDVYAARQLAATTAATFKASARLLGKQAAGPDGTLDFAAFDCYACHHDLKSPSARQQRGYVGVPGRPTFRPAMLSLVKVVADHAAGMPDAPAALKHGSVELDAAYRELTAAFATKTFGDPAKVKAASDKLEQWADRFLGGLSQVRYTREQSNKLLAAVIAAGGSDRPVVADAETAELLTWAVSTLASDAKTAGLDKLVVTKLRPDPMKLVSVEDRLKDRTAVFNGFDADQFRAAFKRIKP